MRTADSAQPLHHVDKYNGLTLGGYFVWQATCILQNTPFFLSPLALCKAPAKNILPKSASHLTNRRLSFNPVQRFLVTGALSLNVFLLIEVNKLTKPLFIPVNLF